MHAALQILRAFQLGNIVVDNCRLVGSWDQNVRTGNVQELHIKDDW